MHKPKYFINFALEKETYSNPLNPKSRKGKRTMKKYIVQYSQTAGAQPSLQSLTKKAPHFIYEFETTDLEEALEVAKKEVEVSDLTTIEELPYSPTDEEFQKNTVRLEILEIDEDEENIDWVEFDSPTYWLEEK